MITFHIKEIKNASAWRRALPRRRRPHRRPVRRCRATGRAIELGRTWIAFWPVRPTRALRGALWHIHRTCEHEAYGSDLTPLVRLPLRPNGVRTAPILLRSWPPSTTKSFLPAKVVFAGSC